MLPGLGRRLAPSFPGAEGEPGNQNRNGAHSDTAADLDPGLRCAAPG
jgi:hypothetical protein